MDTATLQQILSIALFAMLFSLGMGLTLADFRAVIAKPRGFVTAFACQLLLLPLLAVLVAAGFGLQGAAALGLLLLAVSPGGVTSNLFTRLSGGSTAMSVALTAINSLLAVVTIPAILFAGQWLLGSELRAVSIPFDFLVKKLLIVTFVPVSLGLLIRHFLPVIAARIDRALFPLTAAAFFALIFYLWYAEFETYKQGFITAGYTTTALFIAVCGCSWIIARVSGLPRDQRISMLYEVGIQNPPVAFFIAVNVLNDFALIPPAAVYAVVMVLGALLFATLAKVDARFP